MLWHSATCRDNLFRGRNPPITGDFLRSVAGGAFSSISVSMNQTDNHSENLLSLGPPAGDILHHTGGFTPVGEFPPSQGGHLCGRWVILTQLVYLVYTDHWIYRLQGFILQKLKFDLTHKNPRLQQIQTNLNTT